MKFSIFLLLFLLLINHQACKSIDDQLSCFKNQQMMLKNMGVRTEIFNQLSDSLKFWLDRDLYGIKRFKKGKYKIDDNIFINHKQDKCVVALFKIDTNILHHSYNIELVFGRLLDVKKWQFIISSMPVITYKLGELHSERAGNFEAMSIFLQKKLMEGGYYKKGMCEVNDAWVNGWLTEYLLKYHQEFLEGKRL
jgi:hypothetical protein